MTSNRVRMVQISKFKWNLVSPTGKVMVEDIYVQSDYKAEEWCKAYISSFLNWSYEMIRKETK